MYVDSNIFIYAILDEGENGQKCRTFLRKIENNEISCAISCLVLDEVAWIVRKTKDTKTEIDVWEGILDLPLKILPIDESTSVRALQLIKKYNLKPRDALHAACAIENAISVIYSDDNDFDKVSELQRKTP